MRGENLLEQRRSGSRQSDDEYRVGPAAAYAAPRCEEMRRAHGHLLFGVALDGRRLVTAVALLQRIAAFVIGKRFREL